MWHLSRDSKTARNVCFDLKVSLREKHQGRPGSTSGPRYGCSLAWGLGQVPLTPLASLLKQLIFKQFKFVRREGVLSLPFFYGKKLFSFQILFFPKLSVLPLGRVRAWGPRCHCGAVLAVRFQQTPEIPEPVEKRLDPAATGFFGTARTVQITKITGIKLRCPETHPETQNCHFLGEIP